MVDPYDNRPRSPVNVPLQNATHLTLDQLATGDVGLVSTGPSAAGVQSCQEVLQQLGVQSLATKRNAFRRNGAEGDPKAHNAPGYNGPY